MTLGTIDRLDEVRGIVQDDPGSVVRGARPLRGDEVAARALREQMIARMMGRA